LAAGGFQLPVPLFSSDLLYVFRLTTLENIALITFCCINELLVAIIPKSLATDIFVDSLRFFYPAKLLVFEKKMLLCSMGASFVCR